VYRHACDEGSGSGGALFIAIKGEKFDAHEKLEDAARGGAVAAMVERIPADCPPNLPLIIVENSRRAMGRLATQVRQKLGGKVIAVGGSNGKTSTKYLIHSVLGASLKGSASPKSFNNDIGVPLAIFPAKTRG
jgi:UDP-N-acetylmuramoyl-tripeptide--D-alanyl-D-alanine ligase